MIVSRLVKVLIKILMIMNKKQLLKGLLTVLRYGITLLLGYLGGSSDIPSLM